MAKIVEAARYIYKGVEYRTEKAALEAWSDDVGKLVDKLIHSPASPRERITLHDNLIKHAAEVAALMDLTRDYINSNDLEDEG